MSWEEYAAVLEPYTRLAFPIATALLAAILVTIVALKANRQYEPVKADSETQKNSQVFSRSEVAKHTNADDVWIILKGKVYNVTPYVQEHPGGEAILRNAGGDATDGFFGPQHPDRVFDLIDDFLIGTLES